MDSKDLTFERYWTLFNPDKEFENRQEAARQEWNAHPEKQESIIAWLSKHGTYRGRNPFFFLKDWQVKQPRQQVLTYNDYYARYGTTEERDGWKKVFQAEQHRTIYLKQ